MSIATAPADHQPVFGRLTSWSVTRALGALLLFTEAAVSRFFGAKMAAQGVPLPNTLRDISNTALTFALLTVILIALAAIDEPDTLADSEGLMRALMMFGVFAGIALVFRALAVWRSRVRGRRRGAVEGRARGGGRPHHVDALL